MEGRRRRHRRISRDCSSVRVCGHELETSRPSTTPDAGESTPPSPSSMIFGTRVPIVADRGSTFGSPGGAHGDRDADLVEMRVAPDEPFIRMRSRPPREHLDGRRLQRGVNTGRRDRAESDSRCPSPELERIHGRPPTFVQMETLR